MRGEVNVSNLNLAQGATPSVENTIFFIGPASNNIGNILSLSGESDFDELLGASDSKLKTILIAARVNAGTNWLAYALPMAADAEHEDYLIAFEDANNEYFKASSCEAVVSLRPCTLDDEIEDWSAAALEQNATNGRQMFVIVGDGGIDSDNQSWSEYEAAASDLVASVAANRVSIVPELHGNDLGVISGRLCNKSVSIADSPMRVATGPVVGLGDTPVDKNGVELSEATLTTLSNSRYSTIQHYADFPGTYWADASTLDAPGGDYQVLEYLRPVLKACRAVRVLGIQSIANRNFNDSEQSTAYYKGFFARPLREMSKSSSVVIGDQTVVLVGDIEKPSKNAVTIVWESKSQVKIGLSVTPYDSPKTIDAFVAIDLSTES